MGGRYGRAGPYTTPKGNGYSFNMSKLAIASCALILGSLVGACGSSGSDDDDGGEAGSGGTAASSGAGGSSASGGSSGSTGKGGSSGSSSTGKGGSSGSGTGGTSGDAGEGGTGGSSAGNGGSGGSSAGKGGSGGSSAGTGGSGGSVSVPGSTPVSDIDTDDEAAAVCEQVAAEVDPEDIEAFTAGTCTLAGLFAEALGGGDCETAKAECEADPEDPTTDGCTAQDFPDCDITVDEFVACTSARVAVAAEYFGDITCDTDFETLGEMEEPEECTSLQERCPEIIELE